MSGHRQGFTERLLHDAGITEGMRVLDCGCGVGEVSRLLAMLVGARGEVVALDSNREHLAKAAAHADAATYPNIRYVEADLNGPLGDLGLFDAAVERRVLMYLPDPVATLREVAGYLKPNAPMVCQESDASMLLGRQPRYPLHDQVLQWIWQTVEREGGNVHMGFALPATLDKAGLAVEHARSESMIQGQDTHLPLHELVRIMLPRMLATEVASASQIDIDTLQQRLARERPDNAAFVSDMAFGAWARNR